MHSLWFAAGNDCFAKNSESRAYEKQCRYTSLLVTLCIILSCLVSYTSTISTPFIDQAASVHSEEAIYNLSITSSGEDICTPEMLGRQELISRPEISHKIRTFSNTYKSLLYLANISDTIHIPLYQGLSEYISVACEPRSTAFIIDYIHMKDGKKKI